MSNYNEVELQILEKVEINLRHGGDPAEIYQDAKQEIFNASENHQLGSMGAGSLVSPSRNLDNRMRLLGFAHVVERSGGPAADWGP